MPVASNPFHSNNCRFFLELALALLTGNPVRLAFSIVDRRFDPLALLLSAVRLLSLRVPLSRSIWQAALAIADCCFGCT
ncbi:hypothetical protein KR51_00020310 [Rubidibacter lacunae KORDI 51-2]|uniref:Uncharacterized protein n=1 Tax=Rubidibacter lacunae KORDI 51-2 TaxID=582515 RepID=U5DIG0_9CHRO|nr:hypothetical protein KR51_00020310 [Rubidibacter lacunae KORDI 51-2]